jgi:hypothetical protein
MDTRWSFAASIRGAHCTPSFRRSRNIVLGVAAPELVAGMGDCSTSPRQPALCFLRAPIGLARAGATCGSACERTLGFRPSATRQDGRRATARMAEKNRLERLLFLLVVAGAPVACGGNSRSADSPGTVRPSSEVKHSSTSRTPSNEHAAVTGDADADRVLDRARAALSEQWEESCGHRAMPAIEEVWSNYAPLNLERIEQSLLRSLRTLDEIGCGQTSAAARTWMYVGLVRAGKNGDRHGAEPAFREALRIDPATLLDEPLADEPARSTWSRLQKELGTERGARVHVPVRERAGLIQALREVAFCASCSVARRARGWIVLGTWQALRGQTAAADSFREALALDPAAELDDRVRPLAAREAMQTARTPSSSR